MAHTHDNECLSYAARYHVGYELRQLAAMAGASHAEPQAELATSGVIEGFLVHLRNIDAFLANRPFAAQRKPTDVVAEDYLQSWSGVEVLDDEHRTSIHRKVAHITCDRNAHFSWNEPAVRLAFAAKAINAVDVFADELERVDADAARWFREAVETSRRELAKSANAEYMFKRA